MKTYRNVGIFLAICSIVSAALALSGIVPEYGPIQPYVTIACAVGLIIVVLNLLRGSTTIVKEEQGSAP